MELTYLQRKLWRLMSEDDRRSLRELCELTGVSSTSVINYNLHRLADKGVLIAPPPTHARSWRVKQAFTENKP